LRRLLVSGEAAARLTEETRALFPGIPFHKIIGMRNRVVHDYGQVDFEIVWETVEHHLPNLMKEPQSFFVERGTLALFLLSSESNGVIVGGYAPPHQLKSAAD
jgi:uncharacterized protein with HEPN domain